MGISTPGIGSGLDVNGIVTKLMSIEQQPLTAINNEVASYQAQLSGYAQIKSALSQFQSAVQGLSSPTQFQAVTATLADATIATASASSGATPGTYALEVSSLAQAQKLVAAGQASTSATIGSGSVTTLSFDFGTIAGGTLSNGTYTGASFTSNGAGTKTVTIDASNNSLSGIRDAINSANIGVSATIVNDGSTAPNRLVLTDNTTGISNSMKISVSGDATLSSLLSQDPANNTGQALAETVTAQNANFKLDGVAVTKTTNTVTDAIQDVTLNLTKTNVGTPTNITVAQDTASVTKAVNAFVTAYNSITQTLASATAYNPTTKQGALFNGDASVSLMQNQIRNVLSTPVAGGGSAYTLLSQIGVTFQKDGTLAVDSTKLQSALTSNFSDIAGLFAAVGKTSDSLVGYSSASALTAPGAYSVNVTQLATQGNATASAAAGLTITAGTNDTLQVLVDGVTANVTIAPGSYASAAALATQIQSQINGTNAFSSLGSTVTVTQSAGVLKITSNRYGSASVANITGGNGQANLNFGGTAVVSNGVDTAGTINGVAAIGSGQYLTGATGDASQGLQIKINGGATGARGTVNYSRGYAYQFNSLATSMLASNGSISSSTDGINASIKRLNVDQQAWAARLTVIEARYRAQFTALDTMISSMNTTSTFLTQQLANLPKIA
ncbi:flagellar hook-associated protein FliD [Sulfuriferula multivorans]|uniref:Flagellar hook-associated protein 2 n=1 Tax=Sulfuriferula multivorans TaxID=1559896 RepID=A0A401JD74_9PROT|nr:flagellar filament capping protein FliD [Sulfuriferula multivorans]GBL45625.1 flagellar hook-associated protein FliD [Sulfuriferula multivorans]